MKPAFPVARWACLAWIAVWAPAYYFTWGARNFLQLCDVSVLLTAIGLWRGSALLLSAQAVGGIVINLLWTIDVASRFFSGRHLLGGTEYMWMDRFPLWVRLLSFFHLAWPVLLLWAVRRTGYHPRGWQLQAAVALAALAASRLLTPERYNVNYAWKAAFVNAQIGPAPVHILACAAALTFAVYLPTHLALRACFRPAPPLPGTPPEGSR
jgi:hypothetical protein